MLLALSGDVEGLSSPGLWSFPAAVVLSPEEGRKVEDMTSNERAPIELEGEPQELPTEPRDRWGRIALVAVLVLALLISLQALRRPRLPTPGSEVPPLTLAMLDGPPIELHSLVGDVVLLDFWATWCPPCVESMPVVERVSRELGPKGVVAIAVNRDDAPKREQLVRRFLERHRLDDLQVAMDDGRAAAAFGITGLPTLIVLGRDGQVAATHLGSIDELGLRRLVEKALQAGPPEG